MSAGLPAPVTAASLKPPAANEDQTMEDARSPASMAGQKRRRDEEDDEEDDSEGDAAMEEDSDDD
jgi:U2 small nuclear ribonucleoprotein B''